MKAAYIGRIFIDNINSFTGKSKIPIINLDGTLQTWTVVVGENNSGKTSFLKALAGLSPIIDTSPYHDKDSSRLVPMGNVNFGIAKNSNLKFGVGCNIVKGEVNVGNTLKKVKFSYHDDNFPPTLPEWNYYPSTKRGSVISGSFRSSLQSTNYLASFQIYGYGVSRKIVRNITSNGEKILGENALTLFYNDKHLTDPTDWLFQLNFASKNSEDKAIQNKVTDRIKHIKKLIIGKIFPDISDLRFTTTEDLTNHLEFKTKDGWFQLHELGYGYQTTLAWIFDLSKKMMERYPDSKQPLREPAVVLIDEIDLHLHPAWQRRIINYLSDSFTATQFIVTTHSPHVLQELEEVNLVQLKRENGATKIICRPNSSFQGWTIEEILNDVLETPSTHSTRYEGLMQKFDKALDNEDYKTAHETYEILSKMLHPNSPDRKILEIQLSQLPA